MGGGGGGGKAHKTNKQNKALEKTRWTIGREKGPRAGQGSKRQGGRGGEAQVSPSTGFFFFFCTTKGKKTYPSEGNGIGGRTCSVIELQPINEKKGWTFIFKNIFNAK